MKLTILPALLLAALPLAAQEVTLQTVREKIPTYAIGAPEADPIFFTGRVYQGAEGYIYPYPLYDVLTDRKTEQEYTVLRLNNPYVDISVLPEIGGRIFSATDKTNDYPFFYTQTGVKPALIGMLGAWLSGGVEWNIPDHHRASSYMPVNWKTVENPDGSKTIWVGETELRHRLKWSVGISVYPGRSWVKADIKVINPTPMIQSMLYWANVSVHCNDDYRVIFPPDVQFGADHHKVYFTPWPYGETTPGNGRTEDLSRWKNFTGNSRSIFAWGSKMEFLAGYDDGRDAGTVHVANRHVVPGKKFFLWGNNPNGEMWNKILSDRDGHYLELMVGAYSDNQPDYSWLAPGELREFSQIWYPVKGIKGVKNATEDAAVNFEPASEDTYRVGYYATALYEHARVVVKHNDRILMEKEITIDPDRYFLEEVAIPAGCNAPELYTALYDAAGNVLADYRPVALEEKPLPKVIDGTKPVKEYETNEELYLAGLRVDQFNNARLDYMDFYNEALARDSMDARVNIEVGKHFIRQGEWAKAETHLLRAQARLSHDYTTVKNTEALYYLGYVYRMTGRPEQAEDAYWKATWTPAHKHRAFYELAVLAAKDNNYPRALELINRSLEVGSRDVQALTLKAYILRKAGKIQEAPAVLDAVHAIEPLDYWSAVERHFAGGSVADFLRTDLTYRNRDIIGVQELLEVVTNYLAVGALPEAGALLDAALTAGEPYSRYPLVYYYKAHLLLESGDKAGATACLAVAGKQSPLNNYPFRLEELALFHSLQAEYPDDAFIPYYLGNLLYYLGQKEKGLACWERSAALRPGFALANRNAGFAYGCLGRPEEALRYYDLAIRANPDDPLLLTESDKLCEQAGIPAPERLRRLEKRMKTVLKHDDAVMRLLTLYNETGRYDKAIRLLAERHFHLWEGGGQVHRIYADSHLLDGMRLLKNKRYEQAVAAFERAALYPANLEVAPSPRGGYEAKIRYLSGVVYEKLNRPDEAKTCFEKAAAAPSRNGADDLVYYRVKALRKLNRTTEADSLLNRMKRTAASLAESSLDSYAKFGEADQQVHRSNVRYFNGLLHLLQGNKEAAGKDFAEAVRLYPGNTWAKLMTETDNRF